MSAIKQIFFLLLSLYLMNTIFTQNNPNDIGKCNCDLSVGQCDLSCCCDNDCSQTDLDIFKCSEQSNGTTRQWCIPNNALFLSNTPYIITTFGDLVCVDLNNTLSLNYYLPPLTDSIEISDSFISLISNAIAPQNVKHSFDIPSSDFPFNKTNYVYSISTTNDISVLSIPMQVGSTCKSGVPVYHYQDKTSNCLVSPQNLNDECKRTKNSPLSLQYFFNQPKFIKKPNSLQNCFQNFQSPTNPFDYYNNCKENYLVQLSIVSCADETGLTIDPNECATKLEPSLNVDTCSFLIKSISYLLRFNSSTGILQAGLIVVFFNQINIITNTKFKEQTFKVYFIPESLQFSDFNLATNQKLSGNPGYLRGKPIVVGSSSSSTDRSNRFTYLIPNTQGLCQNDDTSRATINFRENVVSECFYKPTFDPNSNDYCKLVQNAIDEIILGTVKDKRAIRFAPFANSDPSDWISILNNDPSSQSDVLIINGVCKSIRIGATIQIAFALVGNVANPQAKIQYISYDWDEKTDIKIKCSGQICVSPSNLMIKASTRVIFVDVSQPPLYTESMMARPQTTLPGDFFYPIINSSNKVIVFRHLVFFFVLLFLF